MPVAPIDAPLPSLDGVAETRDREPCPVSLPVPGRPRLDDRDVPVGNLGFYPHLIPQVLGHAFTAPAADAQQVGLGHRHTSILLFELLGSLEAVADTKQTKTIGEHYVAAELARRGWAPALTRDGLERTDILAVLADPDNRRMVEIQVKTARGAARRSISWPLGSKSQGPSEHEREYYVMVTVPHDLTPTPRNFVVPRPHVVAAAWIEHMNWLTEPGIEPGKRNAPVERSRVPLSTFERYEDRWDLLLVNESEAPVLLPERYRDLAQEERVGLPPGHAWHAVLPEW